MDYFFVSFLLDSKGFFLSFSFLNFGGIGIADLIQVFVFLNKFLGFFTAEAMLLAGMLL